MRRSPSQFNWCRGWDSNPHALSGTAPSTQPVYQFQHPGQFRSLMNQADDTVTSTACHHVANTAAQHFPMTPEAGRATQRPASASQSYRETRTCRQVVYLSVRAFITPASPPSRDSHSALRSASGILSHPAKFTRRTRPPVREIPPWPKGAGCQTRRSGRGTWNRKGGVRFLRTPPGTELNQVDCLPIAPD